MKAAVVVVVDMAAVGCSARRAGDARAAAALAVRFWRGLSDAAGAAAAELRNRVPCILLETMKKFTHTHKKKKSGDTAAAVRFARCSISGNKMPEIGEKRTKKKPVFSQSRDKCERSFPKAKGVARV